MSLRKRISLLIFVDSCIVFFSIYIGYFVLHPIENPFNYTFLLLSALTIFMAHHFFALYYGLYRKVWEYASIRELVSIAKAVCFTILTVATIQFLFMGDILIRALSITWMLHMLLIGGSRLSWRVFRDSYLIGEKKVNKAEKRTLIIGAGSAGSMIARQLLNNTDSPLKPIAFLDDDCTKKGLEIFNIRVMGPTELIENVVKDLDIEHIIIAIPSLEKHRSSYLMQKCLDTGIHTQTMPLIEDLLTGKVSVNEIRDVRIEDLLGRDEVVLDTESISMKLTNKKILVTGAGGSIGSEICRQVAKFEPSEIILLGHGENSIYTIDMELRQKVSSVIKIIPIIADIQDRQRVFDIISTHKPDVIYHAAAHKHVPLMEYNPMEAVKNNIFGTKNIAEAADTFGIKHFVMISTDKAVNPPNIMGATKRFAEMIVQNLAKKSNTKFAAVRFGNVLGSRGSVVPLFKKQIAMGGPITVTDPNMTRYFMTIPEASRLVLQAGTLANGGEIFVLDMGEPVKIVDLAKNLIKLSGYTEDEIDIYFTGSRPGEKLYEELLNDNEIQDKFIFPKIHIGKANPINEVELDYVLDKLKGMKVEEMKDILIGLANKENIQFPMGSY
ncbi:nucleoside-diphosphate sugar epimerase/dehydratase [Bacillus sp. FJAT-22090]|uniref:polysaccharide biosynthesis protein n=1 Tax=Bacillus sp. FJAT-22090 TaxID=1581038 RepID=UPI00119EE96C|nr:nucleoside-diphosphate sugar epimerase/dehydratase [Bacillus sp. FJAT-22090]